jgi:hypothetical protein
LAKTAPKDFFSLHHVTIEFIAKSEPYHGRAIPSLRSMLATQCRAFVAAFHTDKQTVLSMLLENEQWEVAAVPREFQVIVDDLCSPAVAERVLATVSGRRAPGGAGTAESVVADTLLVGDARCYVVSAVLMAVKFLMEYVTIAVTLPSVAVDVLQRTVEFVQVRACVRVRVHTAALGSGARPTLMRIAGHSCSTRGRAR